MPAVKSPTAKRTGWPAPNAAPRIWSFEKKPASGGIPAMATVANIIVRKVFGIRFPRPPMARMSCSWCIAMMTEPEPRKRQALKKAWVKTWNIPAPNAPTPHARNM